MTADMRAFYTPSTSSHMSSQCQQHSQPLVDELISKYSSSMAAANNATAASYGKHRSLALRLVDRLRLVYYRYEVTFGVYVMSPGEKFVANTFVVLFLSLLIWASLLCLPHLLFSKIGRLIWLLTGHSGGAVRFFDAASIASSLPRNATSTRAL